MRPNAENRIAAGICLLAFALVLAGWIRGCGTRDGRPLRGAAGPATLAR